MLNKWADDVKRPSLACVLIHFLVLIMLWPCQSQADDLPGPEQVRRFFEDVTLGKRPRAKIVKWLQSPTVRLETLGIGPRNSETGMAIPIPIETDNSHYNFLSDHIQNLSEMSGLNIRLMPKDIGSGGDIVISLAPLVVMPAVTIKGAPKPLLKDLLGPGRCFFIAWPDKEFRLYRAHIVINSTLDENHVRHCLLEELTQSIGMPHDSDRLRPSIFNESSMQPALTRLDRLVIRTLYDPRIVMGSGLGDVRPVVEDVIRSYSTLQ